MSKNHGDVALSDMAKGHGGDGLMDLMILEVISNLYDSDTKPFFLGVDTNQTARHQYASILHLGSILLLSWSMENVAPCKNPQHRSQKEG